MRPPALAEALVAATAPRNDYESIAGDLHEEYLRYARSSGIRAANCWYWSQVLFSIPSLLSYSRSHRSVLGAAGVGLTAIAVLITMLLATIPINVLLEAVFGSLTRCPGWVWFGVDWIDAALFGALLATIVRDGSVRLAFRSASLLVFAFATPALLGFPSSQAPVSAWVLLGGAIPAMCAGAGIYQVAVRRLIGRREVP